jgi:hypothetical protein
MPQQVDDRRAIVARLSLCIVITVLMLLVASAGAHAAAPISPKILETSPASSHVSPASTTTPLVLGEAEPEDGVVIQGTGPLLNGWGASTAAVKNPTQHPEYEILIYAQPECAGAPIGRGRADTFEATGIQVTVPTNALTVISANQVDPNSPTVFSACSGALSYWEGNVPSESGEEGLGGEAGGSAGTGSSSGGSTQQPAGGAVPPAESVGPGVTTGKPEPPKLHMNPKAVANDNSPAIAGSAPGAGSVILYPDGDCSGTPVAKGSAAELSSGFAVQVADNTTTTYSAVSVGGQRSACSSPVTYDEDSTAPVTRVTMGPGVKTRKRKVVFRFADVTEDPPGTSFACKVNKAGWKPCASPFRLGHLRPKRYVVRIRATDLAGNVEKTGAKRIFKVVPAS